MAVVREQKKQQTRAAIVAAAQASFGQRGYHDTTLEDIAEIAHVSPRTIFSYFPSKEAIIFDDYEQLIDNLLAHIAASRPAGISDSIRGFLHTNPALISDPSAKKQALFSTIDANPPLHEYFNTILAKLERQFVSLTAEERGLPQDSIQTRMIAAIYRATFTAMYEAILEGDRDDQAIFTMALAFIDGGLASLKRL